MKALKLIGPTRRCARATAQPGGSRRERAYPVGDEYEPGHERGREHLDGGVDALAAAEDRQRPEEREAEHADAAGGDEAARRERHQDAAGGEDEVRDRHLVAALPELCQHDRPDDREADVDEEAKFVAIEHGPVKAFQMTSGSNTLLSFHIYWLESGILL